MALCWALLSAVKSQNLIYNGEFYGDTANWYTLSSTMSWESNDGAGISGNGSLRNESSFNNGGSFPALSNQFPVKIGYKYLTNASYKIPSDSAVISASYQFAWYDVDGFLIAYTGYVWSGQFPGYDQWLHLTGLVEPPENALWGELRVYFEKPIGGTTLSYGLWDDIFVFEDTIFQSNFD